MIKTLIVEPDGWPCELAECRPGLFVFNDNLHFKTEYGKNEVFVTESGESFWGGTSTDGDRQKLIVQPASCRWAQVED